MNAWLQRIMVSLAVLVLVAGAARLAWELLGPVVPALIALLIAFDGTIFPLYLAVMSAGLIIGGLVSERSQQL